MWKQASAIEGLLSKTSRSVTVTSLAAGSGSGSGSSCGVAAAGGFGAEEAGFFLKSNSATGRSEASDAQTKVKAAANAA
jgi:hypothetical protein